MRRRCWRGTWQVFNLAEHADAPYSSREGSGRLYPITTVVQGIIPEANREGEPGFVGVLYIGGLSLYALMSLALK
jgi:hypothetical protein